MRGSIACSPRLSRLALWAPIAVALVATGWPRPIQAQNAANDQPATPLAPPAAATPEDDSGTDTLPAAVWRDIVARRYARRAKAVALLRERGKAAVPGLIEHLGDSDARVRLVCARLLARHDAPAARLPLLRRLDDPDPEVATAASQALLERASDDLLRDLVTLIPKLDDPDYGRLERLVRALRMRRLFDALAVFHTDGTPEGLRYPGQFAPVMARYPGAVELLIAVVNRKAPERVADLGPTWTRPLALTTAVQALGDARAESAAIALRDLFKRLKAERRGRSQSWRWIGNRMVPYDALFDGLGGDVALQLARLGDDELSTQFFAQQESYLDNATAFQLYRLALARLEVGHAQKARRYLRRALQLVGTIEHGFQDPRLRWLIHLQLAALSLVPPAPEEAATATPRQAPAAPAPRVVPAAGLRIVRGFPGGPAVPRGNEPEAPPEPKLDTPEARRKAALSHLKQAMELGFQDPAWLALDTRFAALGADPAYATLVARLSRVLESAKAREEERRATAAKNATAPTGK